MIYTTYEVEGGGPSFNALDPTADDVEEEIAWFDIFSAVVGA